MSFLDGILTVNDCLFLFSMHNGIVIIVIIMGEMGASIYTCDTITNCSHSKNQWGPILEGFLPEEGVLDMVIDE